MNINAKKEARQLQGVDKWFNNKGIGIFAWATGVGKTYGAKLTITRIEKHLKDSYCIIVPSEALGKQWEKIIEESFTKDLQSRIQIYTVQKLMNSDLRVECGTCIIDEIHEFATDDRLTILSKLKVYWKRILGLTASETDKNFSKITYYIPIIDRITEDEARREGYIADHVEYNLMTTLTSGEKEDYDRYSNIIEKLLGKFQKDLKLVEKCLNGGKDVHGEHYIAIRWAIKLAMSHGWNKDLDFNISKNREIDDKYNPSVLTGDARRLMNAVRNRKSLLYSASNKYLLTIKILKRLSKVKTVVFSESNDFADKLHVMCKDNNMKSVVYHSSLPTKMAPSPKTGKMIKFGIGRQKKEALESIKNGRSRVLLTTKALDRGLDVPDIRAGITTSGSSNSTQYTQRGGRVKRKEEDYVGDTTVLLINIYIKDTVEEGWVKKRQKEVKHEILTITDITEIDYIPPSNIEFTT